jgi:hypothetical protein
LDKVKFIACWYLVALVVSGMFLNVTSLGPSQMVGKEENFLEQLWKLYTGSVLGYEFNLLRVVNWQVVSQE